MLTTGRGAKDACIAKKVPGKSPYAMSDVVFSPSYINTRRLSDVTKTKLSPRAQVSIAHNDMSRVDAMHAARALAQGLVASGKLSNLADLIAKGALPGSAIGGVWANAVFRGASAAYRASAKGSLVPKPTFSVQIIVNGSEYWFDGTMEIEHFYSSSSISYLSGKRQIYVAGIFELSVGQMRGVIHPWLIGDLLEAVDVLPMSFGYTSELYPVSIDAFKKMERAQSPSEKMLRSIMSKISEASVKSAFAAIIGEPFVPKDWGGERSDLYTSRLTIDAAPASAAFLLKGPSVPGPMYIRDLGKQGDQIVRLFEEQADILVVQHCNKIEMAVRKMMRQFAVDPTRPRRYCVIDGADTYRILSLMVLLTRMEISNLSGSPGARKERPNDSAQSELAS